MEMFTVIRFVVGYPLAIVAGLVWALGFGMRWWVSRAGQRDGAAGWAALAGVGAAVYGLTGLAALWMADRIGLGATTSALVTGGLGVLVGVLTAGALWVGRRAWRAGDGNSE